MKVKEIMNKVFIVDSDITIKNAAKIMSQKSIGSLVFLDKKKASGIITERDVLKNIDKLNKKISSVMSKNIISINPEETLEKAASLMSENKIKKLLVLEGEKLLGIISVTDIIANSDTLNEDLFF